jgi:uncharacterized protein (TIGR02145 family)
MKKNAKIVPFVIVAAFLAACGSDESSNPDAWIMEKVPPCRSNSEDNCEYGLLTDERDGQTYKTVKIRDLWWMKENLKYRYLQPTSSMDSSSFCYNDTLEYCEKDGRVYLWSAAMDSAGVFSDNGKGCGYGSECNHAAVVRGVCPAGWHLPSEEEWNNLFQAVGFGNFVGDKLKTTTGWYSNGTDDYSFSVAPVPPMYYNDGQYVFSPRWNTNTEYWSTASKDEFTAVIMYIMNADYYVSVDDYYGFAKMNAAPVRCVKD